MPFPDPFTKQSAQDLIRELADACFPVHLSDHLFKQADLRDVDPGDVMRALCRGIVVEDPQWKADYRNYHVVVEGMSAGVLLRIPCAISEDGSYFEVDVITVIVR